MTLKKALHIIAFTALSFGLFIQDSAAETVDDQVREISYLLMCPVCQGQTVGESNSDLAEDMRGVIRKKLQEGKSKEEVVAYFVGRYGETILAAPPPKGANWLLWLLPAFALACGGLVIGLFLHKSKNREIRNAEKHRGESPTQVEAEYLQKTDKELKEFES